MRPSHNKLSLYTLEHNGPYTQKHFDNKDNEIAQTMICEEFITYARLLPVNKKKYDRCRRVRESLLQSLIKQDLRQ